MRRLSIPIACPDCQEWDAPRITPDPNVRQTFRQNKKWRKFASLTESGIRISINVMRGVHAGTGLYTMGNAGGLSANPINSGLDDKYRRIRK